MREMGSKSMREFRIALSIVDSDTLTRAQAIARYRWGTSARVSLEAGILTVVGPDTPSAIDDYRRAVESGRVR